MKRFSIIALAVAAVMLFAIPAMAADLSFSGHYRARGYYNDNTDLNDDAGATNSWMDMRFRLKTKIKVNDRLSVITRFDALDNKSWGNTDNPQDNAGDDNIDWDRAYIKAKFDYFDLQLGRMGAGTWGTKFLNSAREADRIRIIKKIKPYTIRFTYEKTVEDDKGQVDSDNDEDRYMADIAYKAKGINTGLFLGYYRDMDESDAAVNPYARKYWFVGPYIKGTYGPVKYEAELGCKTGDYKDMYDAGAQDQDYDAWAYHVNLATDLGPTTVSLGYAHTDGDDDNDKGEYNAYGLGGNDWQPLLILTGFYSDRTLGGLRNLNSHKNNTDIQKSGYDLYYGTVSFSPMENVTLNAIIGTAKADETSHLENTYKQSVDDDYGVEYDVGCKIKLMDNLVYQIKAAYLSAGDLWKATTGKNEVDDTYSFFHELKVTF